MRGWRVEVRAGTAAELHASWPTLVARTGSRAVAVCEVSEPCVVLGSAQSDAVVDPEGAAARGFGVAHRRTGGGAVLVAGGDPVWVDLWLPAGDVLASADVGRSFDWLGEAWVSALEKLGLVGISRRLARPVARTRWSSLVCFGGIGRGEVVTRDGRKVVGLAQRRTRLGSWYQCACALRWDPVPLLSALALGADQRDRAGRELAHAAVGLADLAVPGGAPVTGQSVAAALVDSLP